MVIIWALALIPGIIIFAFLNNIFDITYFGFKGIVSVFGGCWFAATIVIYFLGMIAVWLIPIFIVLWILTKIFKRA